MKVDELIKVEVKGNELIFSSNQYAYEAHVGKEDVHHEVFKFDGYRDNLFYVMLEPCFYVTKFEVFEALTVFLRHLYWFLREADFEEGNYVMGVTSNDSDDFENLEFSFKMYKEM